MPGRPRTLSQTKILEAAAEVLPEDPSFASVSEQLGVSPQALYKYFPNARSMQAHLAVRLLGDFADRQERGEAATDLEGFLVDYGLRYRDWLSETGYNPSIFAPSFDGQEFQTPEAMAILLRLLDTFIVASASFDVPKQQAVTLWIAIIDFLLNTSLLSLGNEEYLSFEQSLASEVDAEPGGFPHVAGYLDGAGDRTSQVQNLFEFKLRALSRGLVAQIATESP